MSESRDYLELSFRSIECFSNDGKLDAGELGRLLAIAERDEVIDDNEKRVLRNILARIKPDEIDGDMKAMIQVVIDKIS